MVLEKGRGREISSNGDASSITLIVTTTAKVATAKTKAAAASAAIAISTATTGTTATAVIAATATAAATTIHVGGGKCFFVLTCHLFRLLERRGLVRPVEAGQGDEAVATEQEDRVLCAAPGAVAVVAATGINKSTVGITSETQSVHCTYLWWIDYYRYRVFFLMIIQVTNFRPSYSCDRENSSDKIDAYYI